MKILKLSKAILLVFFAFIYLLFSQTNLPPIPDTPMNTLDELKYMINTDVQDRMFYLDTSLTSNLAIMQKNDSIRLSRVLYFLNNGFLKTPLEKYYASFILLHGLQYKKALELCEEIINSDTKDVIIDTIPSQIFSKYYFFNEIKNDSNLSIIMSKNRSDTFFILSRPLKLSAMTRKRLLEVYLDSGETSDSNYTITIEKLNDPNYIPKLKTSIKNRMLKDIAKDYPHLLNAISEEKLDKFIDEQINLINNFINIMKEVIKKVQIK